MNEIVSAPHSSSILTRSYDELSLPGLNWKIFNLSDMIQKPRDVMIDLETVDNSVTSAIASIGACVFDKDGIYHTFYCVVDHKTCIEAGMSVSQDTLDWWAKQSEQARKIFHPDTPKLTLYEALMEFARWFAAVGGKELWGNGSDFDNAIMSFAYKLLGIKQPWSYSGNRCFRTIKNGAYIQARRGTYHNALDDAITQAQYMIDKKLMPAR